MTVDLSEFTELTKPARKPTLTETAIEQVEEPERTQLLAAMARSNEEISCQAISIWLERRGVKLTANAISAYRREHKS